MGVGKKGEGKGKLTRLKGREDQGGEERLDHVLKGKAFCEDLKKGWRIPMSSKKGKGHIIGLGKQELTAVADEWTSRSRWKH